jgi:predicted deacylase
MGKNVLLFVGEKSKELNPTITNERVNGTKNVRIRLGVVEGKIAVRETPVFIEKTKWLRASHSGMFKIKVANGSFIRKKMSLGVLQDPFREFKKNICAPFYESTFCINKTPIVNKGDALFHMRIVA